MSNEVLETNDLLGELAGLGNLDDVQVEVETATNEATKEKKVKEVKPKFEAEDFEVDTTFAHQPAENMDTYLKDWCYLTDLMIVGNVRHSYTGLEELAPKIITMGLVNKITVISPENDCLPSISVEEIEYKDGVITLNTEGKLHLIDGHRRFLSILNGLTNPVRVLAGTDENGDNVYKEVTFPESYRLPITHYSKKIENVLERKVIQNTFNQVEEITEYDRLVLSLEAMCEFDEVKGKFVKPARALANLGGADTMKLGNGASNYMTGIGKVLRFMFGGTPPKNPTDFNTVLNDTQKTFLRLIENNFVGSSTLVNKVLNVTYDGAAKSADYVWAVDLSEMVEYMLSVIKADNRNIDDLQTGNPIITSTMLHGWIKGKTDIANSLLAAENAATKAANAPATAKDATPTTEDLTQGEIPQDSGLKAISPLDVIKDTENTPILNMFAELRAKFNTHGTLYGTPVPVMFDKFLEICSNIESGDQAVGDVFTFFKQVELGLDLTTTVETEENDLPNDLGDLEDFEY